MITDTILTTDRPTVIPPYGARHIDNGAETLCGRAIGPADVRFDAVPDQRISCRFCANADSDEPYAFQQDVSRALAAERRATVERIRAACHAYDDGRPKALAERLLAALDAEAER